MTWPAFLRSFICLGLNSLAGARMVIFIVLVVFLPIVFYLSMCCPFCWTGGEEN